MRKMMKKAMAAILSAAMLISLAGCGGNAGQSAQSSAGTAESGQAETGNTAASNDGISADSPYADKGLDLSEPVTVIMYALGDRPEDMDKVLEELNSKYLNPWLNTTLEMQFLNWSDYTTKYSLVLAGSEPVDLMYTSSWCYYNDEAAKGAFRELDQEWLEKYMPISYPQQPAESWDQISINGKIFAVPKSNAAFNGYNFIAVRQDLMEKYGIETIDSWDSMKEYLYAAVDDKGSGISASGQSANREEYLNLWNQNEGLNVLAVGFDFLYPHHNSEAAPDFDKDVFYKYTSESFKNYCLEMAEMAARGVWSSNAINDTNESRAAFENGTSASFVWNETIYDAGKALEEAGLGTYAAYDITPDVSRARGSYADDAVAITTNSKNPERAALVLDCLKGFTEVNNLILGGIEGVHWTLNEDGTRGLTEESGKYAWNSWAWGIQRGDQPDEEGMDPRKLEFREKCEAKEFVPETAGFTFDKSPVETELSVINAIRDEYLTSFFLGVLGDQTEAKFEEFKGKLEAAGLDKVTAEMKRQYEAFCEKKGYNQ